MSPHIPGEQKKIAVHAAAEHFTVGDLCFAAFTWPELRLAFQIDVPCRKESLFDIGVDRTDRHIPFRMVRNNLIRRLPLIDQMGYQLVFFASSDLVILIPLLEVLRVSRYLRWAKRASYRYLWEMEHLWSGLSQPLQT